MSTPTGSCRRLRPRLAGTLLVSLAVAACGGSSTSVSHTAPTAHVTAAPTPVPGTATPTAAPPPASPCAVGAQAPPSTTIAAAYPTALAFAPDGRLFWAERGGAVRVWQNGAARLFASVATVTVEPGGGYSERGLLGIAISPTFARDGYIYAFYSDPDYAHQHVIRWRDCAGVASQATVIVTLPSGADCCHKGGRLAFGADGMLYVTLGEEHAAAAAQNTADVRGKVLRYRPDGSVPADNPFGPTDAVFAFGLRNPFGIAVSASGQIAVTSNGPSGDAGSPSTGYDVVISNLLRGQGRQWPACYGYSHPLAAAACPAGQPGPDWSSEASTLIPTGAAFVDSAGPAGYAGHLVFCSFAAGMRVLTPGSPHASVSGGPSGCRLDVKEGPDHALYFSDTGHIYRLA